ncbi:LacI family DNA-binding transcriptional regulator [Streptomyces iconiensis]|uniref:LacI family DNA-binding transcriptional regulator n=1 Tax=Streptomyces iconiensis TaxID=1384038 RepID=A0ABT6ZXT8_9ACTN|nr:LacI family DNA-binding transcriptional regulator [Streptomyces iconiensis]MDJ1133877.1 LacI family DNA-binding transcriptional regulator [Streptomyces iconiensis]
MSDGGPPTIVSIAERAGVSIASVSRVLNGVGARPDTVRKVERAATELGYVPNAVAQSLKGGRTKQLTFAMQDIGNPVYVAMVREIQAVTRTAGYRLLLHSTDAVIEDELAVVRSLGDRTSDGLILCPIRITPEHVEVLKNAAGPVVVIGSLPGDVPVDAVQADSISGAALAVEHLAATGRRRIAFINGPVDTVPGTNRRQGYLTALAEHGLAPDPALERATSFGLAAGREAMLDLLDSGAAPDAVLGANDQLALGASQAAHERGLRIPEDLAITGMDDSDLARAGWPPLTSVDLGSEERGRTAARMLLERLAGAVPDEQPARRTTAAPRLVVRGSTDAAYDHASASASVPAHASAPTGASASASASAPASGHASAPASGQVGVRGEGR